LLQWHQKFCSFFTPKNIFTDPQNIIKFSQKFNHREGAFTSTLCELIKNYKYFKNDADQVLNDADPIKADQPVIGAIKEELRGQLTSIASKLLSSEHTKLEDLSVEEQHLWKSFDNSDIYEFITGEPDCLPEFQFDWIEPCQLAAHFPPGVVLAHPRDFLPPQDQNKPPDQQAPPPPQPAQPPVQRAQPQDQPKPVDQPAQAPAQIAPPVADPSKAQPPPHQHDLCPRPDLNYKEIHTGIKPPCRKLQRQAKAVVTKLAPWAFSSKPPKDNPSPDQSTPGPSS
jgi:hypothetical protein